jgi:hypothetical protein
MHLDRDNDWRRHHAVHAVPRQLYACYDNCRGLCPADHIPLCDDKAAAQQRRLAAKADDEVAGLDECFVQD